VQRESRGSRRASRAAGRPDVDALLAAVREARGIPRSARPRFQRDVNLAESPAPERLVVYGDALVVVGPAFRGGEGYFHYGVSVASPEDLVDVRTADLTGDGRQEVLLFAKQRLGEITRTLLLVHQFTRDGGFPRLLAVEVGREQDRQRVTNEVQTRGGRLVVRPGRARGWDAESWPWAASDGSDGVEPLLLPWSDRPRTYRYRGGRLVR
ncbi:MAG TPA: hypothetical protein RMG45_25420, partial [Polyangiaceae bacterium LLY-WYZ-15_(1-7)]|nr:hypothetical protein [Polyangiaceae bacterium LLY-WYZ-15_(1-7)]